METVDARRLVQVVEVELEAVDHTTVKEFKRVLASATAPGARVVLDLGRVKFMDSSGLGALLSILRSLAETGGELKACRLTPSVRILFELVRIHRIFDILETRDDAFASFGA